MVMRRMGIFLFLLTVYCSSSSSMHVPRASKDDEKKFNDLVDVSFTKSMLASQKRKTTRIEDLQCLAALMIDNVAGKIERTMALDIGVFDTANYNAMLVQGYEDNHGQLRRYINAGRIKPDVKAASIYATNLFDIKYEGLMDKAFRANVSKLTYKKLTDEQHAIVKILREMNLDPADKNFPSFIDFVDLGVKKTLNEESYNDEMKKLQVLLPDKEQCTNAFTVALEDLNFYYKKVIEAILKVDSKARLVVPVALEFSIFLKPGVKDVLPAETNIVCPICLEDIEIANGVYTPCMHAFHKACIEQALRNNPVCPICRQNIKKNDLKKLTTDIMPRIKGS